MFLYRNALFSLYFVKLFDVVLCCGIDLLQNALFVRVDPSVVLQCAQAAGLDKGLGSHGHVQYLRLDVDVPTLIPFVFSFGLLSLPTL